jgi:hypothetical protein
LEIPDVSNGSHDPNSVADLLNAARQVLDDIDAMATGSNEEFGGFSDWRLSPRDDDGVVVTWPNLAISAATLREALTTSRR